MDPKQCLAWAQPKLDSKQITTPRHYWVKSWLKQPSSSDKVVQVIPLNRGLN